MKLLSGKIVDGKIEIPASMAAEGDRVMVLAPATEPVPRLTREQQQELLDSMEQIRAGQSVDGDELLQELRDAGL